MNKNIKDKWVKALRSGKYEQGKGKLRTKDNKFCCLGVLTDIYQKTEHKGRWLKLSDAEGESGYTFSFNPSKGADGLEKSVVPINVENWSGLGSCNPNVVASDGQHHVSLATLNDAGVAFADIADIIEAQL